MIENFTREAAAALLDSIITNFNRRVDPIAETRTLAWIYSTLIRHSKHAKSVQAKHIVVSHSVPFIYI